MSRVVPWMCREEWMMTYQDLYDFQNTKSQAKGVERVQAWKSRSSSKLPLSIETTASLIAATISDVEESLTSPLTVRLTMAMAVVRFVNGMVDMEQKGVYARSVQSIADDIGLPDWLVDLRHEATHAALPSLEVLRAGCQFSLHWLQEQYWESQRAEILERDEKLVKLVQNFIEDYERGLSKSEEKKTRKRKNLDVIKEIVDLTCEYDMWDVVLDMLICKLGLMIPSPATLKNFSTYWSDINEHSTASVCMDLPKEALSMWSPLFKAWQKGNDMFLSNLVTTLVKRVHEFEINSENFFLIRYFACWVHFVLSNCGNQNRDEKQWKIKAKLDYSTILEVCLRNCSSYSPYFLPLIIRNLKLIPDKLKQKLEKLSTCLAFGTSNGAVSWTRDGSPTVKDKPNVYDNLAKNFPEFAHRVEPRLKQQTEFKNDAGWQLCSPSFPRSVPLGCLIGTEPLQFELLEFPEELDPMQVDAYEIQGTSLEPTKDDYEVSRHVFEVSHHVVKQDSENERSSEMQCETSIENCKNAFESISQQIWIF